MAPSIKNIQLTSLATAATNGLEEVRLLDFYEDRNYDGSVGIEEGLNRIHVGVTGMICAACSNYVEVALNAVDDVISASVALLQNKADVVYKPSLVKDVHIKNEIEDAGFEAEILPEPSVDSLRKKSHGTLVG
ncbi:hypothetical protein QN277_008245 [Acacia crassicarpa]|uniref:HMA domain-containing protein n=1 Tax=Acacia crassicarpa TaxID=499986 RepID=A0AAE1M726_9FABA|nr:hypothetical protein QN277_008245 [Acacia crassicarpa]